jgi:hypothetical protein
MVRDKNDPKPRARGRSTRCPERTEPADSTEQTERTEDDLPEGTIHVEYPDFSAAAQERASRRESLLCHEGEVTREQFETQGFNTWDFAVKWQEWRQGQQEERAALKAQIEELQGELTETNTAYEDVVNRLEESEAAKAAAIAERDEAIQARNARTNELYELHATTAAAVDHGARTGSSGTPAAESRGSAKLADPPLLDDGREVQYEAWETQMKLKMAANADHFPTPSMRIAYVSSRCTGEAYKHLAARLRTGASMPYHDDCDVFEHLREVFGDPNRLENAQTEYHELRMKANEKYQTFVSRFLYLADEAEIPKINRKRDLWRKLPKSLQTQVIAELHRKEGTFVEFNTLVSQTADSLDTINRQNRFGRTTTGTYSSMTGAALNKRPTGTEFKRETLTPDERTALMREGRCFVCKKSGHISRDCPDKPKETTVAAIGPAAATTEALKGLEQNETVQPGNA